jgi:hypothetical protein
LRILDMCTSDNNDNNNNNNKNNNMVTKHMKNIINK